MVDPEQLNQADQAAMAKQDEGMFTEKKQYP
jgi:hypothetical protein